MQFVAIHNVTPDDVARATRLTTRSTEVLLSIFVVLVLAAILSQVVYAFSLYLRAVTDYPQRLVDLLLGAGGVEAVVAWLSIIVTLSLPIFLFYAVRSLAETIWPVWRVRRLIKSSDILGPTTYTIDDNGVRAVRSGGADTFQPWTSFDGLQCDERMAALTRKSRLLFFVPLVAFGTERDAVLAQLKSHVSAGKVSSR
jgi:hypothetical protein